MSPAERMKVLLFLALFFGAAGILFTLLSCGTEYWLLAVESCGRTEEARGGGGGGGGGGTSRAEADGGVTIFHEGLFWRCSFAALSREYSVWDLWMSNQPPSKVCQAAFLFPFPAHEPGRGYKVDVYERPSAIVFRTFWSIFLVTGLAAIFTGGFVVVCAGPLANQRLYKAGGALQLCGSLSLLAVLVLYLMWVQVLDTLEEFAHHQAVSGCPSFHLSVQHGPSFLLAPVAVFFSLLAGLLFILVGGRGVEGARPGQTRDKMPELPASDVYV